MDSYCMQVHWHVVDAYLEWQVKLYCRPGAFNDNYYFFTHNLDGFSILKITLKLENIDIYAPCIYNNTHTIGEWIDCLIQIQQTNLVL